MENTIKRIAVLIATYNGERFLCEQIDSVTNQIGVKVSVLIRDDGSTDGTIDILNKYQSEGKVNWFNNKHMNAAENFFELLKKTKHADYYAFCDQDDKWYEDKLLIAVNQLEKTDNHKGALYCCGSRLVNEKLEFIKYHKMDVNRSLEARLFFANVAGNTMVLDNHLREKIIKYSPRNMIMHDAWIFDLALCLGSDIIVDPEPHLDYRQHRNNVVGMELNFQAKIKKFIKIINEKLVYKQLMEIKQAYASEIIEEYNNILELTEDAKQNFGKRVQLAFDKRIKFNNLFFDLAFKLKVLSNNL